MSNSFIIREATEADLEQIMALENSCFGSDAWDQDTMHFEVVAHHTHYLAALEGDALIGFAGLSKIPGNEQADIQTIAVAQSARGKGIGKALMLDLLKEARRL
ncbi:MAG: hypothetical protein RLY34_806, partial [Actinomycetota bacterium]